MAFTYRGDSDISESEWHQILSVGGGGGGGWAVRSLVGCPLGYDDFNNLVALIRWWLHNLILRHVYKKRFSFFQPHLHSKFRKNANRSKKMSWKIQYRDYAAFKYLEKVLKKCTKKVISKNVTEIFTFSTFTHVRQTCFAYNFFWFIFSKLFLRIWNQHGLLGFFIHFLFFQINILFRSYSYVFQTLKPNAQKTSPKIKKTN